LGSQQVGSAFGGEISPASIISKLTLLTMHMKKLRILWSKSPAHTAEIFQQLRKQHRQDPDLDKIANQRFFNCSLSDGSLTY